jgi:hypothetical protein
MNIDFIDYLDMRGPAVSDTSPASTLDSELLAEFKKMALKHDIKFVTPRFPRPKGADLGDILLFAGSSSMLEGGPASNMSLHILKKRIDAGETVVFMDMEARFDTEWLSEVGVDHK